MENVNLLTIFITGLLTGGLTCMAVQGGLLAATLAQSEEERLTRHLKKGSALPIISFLIAKLIAYTLLGFLLGWAGSFFKLSLTAQVVLQFFVAIFMIGTALNIMNIHPIFRYFIIQPPKFLTRLLRKQSKSKNIFAPATLGAFTVFIPCGTTQAMMALAIASSSPLLGSAIMFAFVLGTSPVFFILGYFATKLGDIYQQKFMRIAALAIILLAVFNINNAIALTGSNFTIEKILNSFMCTISWCDKHLTNMPASNTVNEATITINSSAYEPDSINVKAGSNIKLHLINKNGSNCIQAFTIPQLGIQKIVPLGQSADITFTAPDQPGKINFMCSMGMYQGVINVI